MLSVPTELKAKYNNALEHRAPIDWVAVESWAAQIVRDELSVVRESFRSHDAGGPDVMWTPVTDEIGQEKLKFLLEYWSGLASNGSIPLASRVDPIEVRPALPDV